ncbi:MAG: ATP synthase F1 subunit delta [Rhodothermales bacterium]
MNNLTIARRYAQALYEEAARAQCVDGVDEDIALIRDALGGSRELVRFFESPVISREKKESVVQSLFAERVQPTTLRFLRLLIGKKREELFPDVVRAYHALRDEQVGIVEAQVRVAYPLSEQEETQLAQALERMEGRRIRLHVELDAGLLGGLVVRIGDTVYDGSVSHQLTSLRERMELGSAMLN